MGKSSLMLTRKDDPLSNQRTRETKGFLKVAGTCCSPFVSDLLRIRSLPHAALEKRSRRTNRFYGYSISKSMGTFLSVCLSRWSILSGRRSLLCSSKDHDFYRHVLLRFARGIAICNYQLYTSMSSPRMKLIRSSFPTKQKEREREIARTSK